MYVYYVSGQEKWQEQQCWAKRSLFVGYRSVGRGCGQEGLID